MPKNDIYVLLIRANDRRHILSLDEYTAIDSADLAGSIAKLVNRREAIEEVRKRRETRC